MPLSPEEPRLLARRAMWCGAVFSLAVLLTALNLLPPGPVHYRVRSELVVGANRIAQLDALVEQRRSDSRGTRLLNVEILDTARTDAPASSEDPVALVAVDSLWGKRCTQAEHLAWIESITRSAESKLADSKVARQHRFAQWQLAATRHYAARHEFLQSGDASEPQSTRRNFELVSATGQSRSQADATPSPSTFTLGYPQPSPSEQRFSQAPTAEPDVQEIKDALDKQVKQAEAKYLAAQIAWRSALQESDGLVRSVSAPKISVLTHTAPWLVACLLILGATSGSIGGWFQHRLHSSAAYAPSLVSAKLALQGLPMAGQFKVEQLDQEEDWLDATGQSAGGVTRKLARNFILVSEWIVAFWCLCLLLRWLCDPLWRTAFFASPLGALARILSGMP